MNNSDGVIIGGGGLFIVDTNPNQLSGWQWSCSIDRLRQIRKPLAVFGVGYNRFRDQPDFGPMFSAHLAELSEKAVYVGLRNSGSIEAIRGYLPDELRAKVRFQPCPTTVLSKLYPTLTDPQSEGLVGINCAFDRPQNRYGDRQETILQEVANGLADGVNGREIVVICHTPSDDGIVPFIQRAGLRYRVVRLDRVSPVEVLEFYRRMELVVGMRGHAQMIPFGCRVPIVSVVSHDKLRWFLDDVGGPEWAVDVRSMGLREELSSAVSGALGDPSRRSRMAEMQEVLWEVTQTNVRDFLSVATQS